MRRFSYLFLLFTYFLFGQELWALTPVQMKSFRSSVCSIYVNASRSAYNSPGSWQGTGFVCDKKRGIICTNHHVVGRSGVVATYDVEFMDGQKLEARLLYADPWHDFAFVEIVDPLLIPEGVQELSQFARPRLGEPVFIAGNNEGQSFSFQEGRVSDLYAGWGFMPEPAFGCVINAVGGSSGSPVVNEKLEVVGINFAGFGDGRCLEIRGSVLQDALIQLQKGQLPLRRHFGGMLKLGSLETQLKVFQFPRDVAQKYLKDYPAAALRVLKIAGVLSGSPAEGILEVEDVLVSINGNAVGPDLGLLETMLNEAKTDTVMVGFYRNGQFLEKKIGLYNIHDFAIKRLVIFGGMTFFEADDFMRWQFGVRPHQVMALNVLPGSAFAPIIQNLGAQIFLLDAENMDVFLGTVSGWLAKKTFPFYYRALTPVHSGDDAVYFINRFKRVARVTYEPSQNQPPELLERSFKDREWKRVP